ncbi:hypothetical protein J2125_001323 [Erwinia toletana]|uniref:Uncharacterized protein n=1 Tax=Winslowiella toletana TaxID=92490 RepID=A0ABS4P7S1_9GAMM|nr:hypothetical protein [Winslowiella toletana]MBP2168131.1 hypothetical protein [Winslowiella toletana]
MSFGTDPIPNITLFGNQKAEFFVSDGGKGTPEAAAKYDSKIKQLVMVHPRNELPDLMKILKKAEKR